jgi:protein SCO1/2
MKDAEDGMSALSRSLIALAAVCVVVAAAVAAWVLTPAGGDESSQTGGQAAIGGSFELVDTQGKTVTEQDFRGRYMLVYFGFTYCPDVCPSSLMDMSRALDRLAENAPEKAEAVAPVFITVDPERDDPTAMAEYVENFHPRLIGLTGSPEQVKAAADTFRVYYEKVSPQEYFGSEAAAEGTEADYLMAHSSYMLLMGPEGGYITNFKYAATATEIAEGLAEHVQP